MDKKIKKVQKELKKAEKSTSKLLKADIKQDKKMKMLKEKC